MHCVSSIDASRSGIEAQLVHEPDSWYRSRTAGTGAGQLAQEPDSWYRGQTAGT